MEMDSHDGVIDVGGEPVLLGVWGRSAPVCMCRGEREVVSFWSGGECPLHQ